ncbi:hypothetical protein GVN16_01945 [Emticicia sp. CRIBPO]|uniref:LIC_13387 family protein n=1 Tax=Emticicia sp. CRIBPO TaxID=2683258 RepID=UPI0014128609|nr:hypothetical protein [Emticicia sp. CRIBPO]NBA84503.1 hypothetical protein [Emticicia sp. CRIBPO]
MFKKYKFWTRLSIFFSLATACLHTIGLVSGFKPQNPGEKTLIDLMNNYKLDLGLGFVRTMNNLMTSFSISFTLLFVFVAMISGVAVQKYTTIVVARSLLGYSVVIFAACFVTMCVLTFIIPIVCVGLVFVSLLFAWVLSMRPAE